MSFCIAFTSQPGCDECGATPESASVAVPEEKTLASQSRSSGCVGQSPCEPKFSADFTKPLPKYICQYRFTVTRAVRGWSSCTSHRAKSRRVSAVPAGAGGGASADAL